MHTVAHVSNRLDRDCFERVKAVTERAERRFPPGYLTTSNKPKKNKERNVAGRRALVRAPGTRIIRVADRGVDNRGYSISGARYLHVVPRSRVDEHVYMRVCVTCVAYLTLSRGPEDVSATRAQCGNQTRFLFAVRIYQHAGLLQFAALSLSLIRPLVTREDR